MREPKQKVIVHPTSKGWTWTQVARNGSAGAIAPTTFDNRSNAKRAGTRQVAALNWAHTQTLPVGEVPNPDNLVAVLVVDEHYRRSF